MKKPQIVVRAPSSVSNFLFAQEGATADEIAGGGKIQAGDLAPQLRRDDFIGVHRQHPIVAASIQGKILLIDKRVERPGKELGLRMRLRELARSVGRTGIDDNNFVAELQCLEAAGDVVQFVVANDGRGDGGAGERVWGLAPFGGTNHGTVPLGQ